MKRSNRLIIMLVGMAALAVPMAIAPMLIRGIGWLFFWPYFVNYPPDASAETAARWLLVLSIAVPAVIYLAALFFAVKWMLKGVPD